MNKSILEVIGAIVITIVILGLPILSFMSVIYDWHEFFQWLIFIGLIVDFLCVASMLIGEEE